MSDRIRFENVSKFYGEVLGVNRVDLSLGPGITALVGPNGSGKSTLMNLMTGLLRPTRGRVEVLGISPRDPADLLPRVGYCTQYDAFPRGVKGRQLLLSTLRFHGIRGEEARQSADRVLDRVQLAYAARRKVAGYSKGMRQRIKLASALVHEPRILVLDEPLNGLDPMARAELIGLFQELATEGRHVIVSSHILHEVDMIADRVVLLNQGYVVARGDIPEVREEMTEHPLQILVRSPEAPDLAGIFFRHEHVVQVELLDDRKGLIVKTRRPESLYLLLNRLVVEEDLPVESVAPADEDVLAVYEYLIGPEGEVV
ncbi:MAG: ABC transporter ATP-binding protein [Thermoanaerobaculia bacterium]|nr:ABC transporter ATP-binding protein [Thermoanaerobaculia bacterium]